MMEGRQAGAQGSEVDTRADKRDDGAWRVRVLSLQDCVLLCVVRVVRKGSERRLDACVAEMYTEASAKAKSLGCSSALRLPP